MIEKSTELGQDSIDKEVAANSRATSVRSLDQSTTTYAGAGEAVPNRPTADEGASSAAQVEDPYADGLNGLIPMEILLEMISFPA